QTRTPALTILVIMLSACGVGFVRGQGGTGKDLAKTSTPPKKTISTKRAPGRKTSRSAKTPPPTNTSPVNANSNMPRPTETITSTGSSKQGPHFVTMRVQNDSTGSRVSMAADFSLNDYEAYNRGDRFYVKVPLGQVQVVKFVRGRCFEDVKAQQI